MNSGEEMPDPPLQPVILAGGLIYNPLFISISNILGRMFTIPYAAAEPFCIASVLCVHALSAQKQGVGPPHATSGTIEIAMLDEFRSMSIKG
jgi:hypothetical protein